MADDIKRVLKMLKENALLVGTQTRAQPTTRRSNVVEEEALLADPTRKKKKPTVGYI